MFLRRVSVKGTTKERERRKSNEETETKNPLYDRGGSDGVFNINEELVMTITIEIKDGLAGYEFKDGNGEIVQFEKLPRVEQVRILNSFANGYNLFLKALNDD